MVFFGACGLQHTVGLFMLVPDQSNIGTKPDSEKKNGKNVDFLKKTSPCKLLVGYMTIQ
jgi:hypothetical protein